MQEETPQYLVFFGPPAVGKGTQAERLAEVLGGPHISTGALFRAERDSGSDLGRELAEYMGQGALVPDDVTTRVVERRLAADDVASRGFILDGYPRTVAQAEALERLCEEFALPLHGVINFTAPESVLVERIAGRRTCASCGRVYHQVNNPPRVEGVCDACAGALTQRPDDTDDVFRERLATYTRETEPLIDFYRERDLLTNVLATASPDIVFDTLVRVVDRLIAQNEAG